MKFLNFLKFSIIIFFQINGILQIILLTRNTVINDKSTVIRYDCDLQCLTCMLSISNPSKMCYSVHGLKARAILIAFLFIIIFTTFSIWTELQRLCEVFRAVFLLHVLMCKWKQILLSLHLAGDRLSIAHRKFYERY